MWRENYKQWILLLMFQLQLGEQRSCKLHDMKLTMSRIPSTIPKNTTKFTILGFFPTRVTTETESDYNRSGFLWRQAAIFALNEINKLFERLRIRITLEMISFDTCNQVDMALWSLLHVFMTDQRQFKTDCCSEKRPDRIIGTIGPASSSTADKIYNLLQFYHMPLISYSATSVRFDEKSKYSMFMRTIPADNLQARMIVDILVKYNWIYVALVYQDNEYGRMGHQKLKDNFLARKICFAKVTPLQYPFNNNQVETFAKTMNNEKLSNVIILWASGPVSDAFLELLPKYKLFHKTWITTESVGINTNFPSLDHKVVQGLLSVVPFAGHYPLFRHSLRKETYSSNSHDLWFEKLFKISFKNQQPLPNTTINQYWNKLPFTKVGYVRNAVFAYGEALKMYAKRNIHFLQTNRKELSINRSHFFHDYLKKVRFAGLSDEEVTFDSQNNINSAMFHLYSLQLNGKNLAWQKVGEWNKKIGLKTTNNTITWGGYRSKPPKSTCSNPCKEGFYPIYDAQSCCWTCVKCAFGYFKEEKGIHMCKKCPSDTTVSENRTVCFLLHTIFVHTTGKQAAVLFLGTASTSSIAIFFMAVFTVQRNTPIVRSSQYELSMMQLGVLILLSASSLLFVGAPTKIICVARISSISILLTVIYSFTFIKMQRLIKVFGRKLRVSKSERRNELSLTILLTSLPVLGSVILLLLMVDQSSVKVTNRFDRKEKHVHCNNQVVYFAEFAYCLVLSTLCGVQAIRSRRLPQYFKEIKSIAYAMFTSGLLLILSVLLSQNAPNPTMEAFITSVCIILLDSVILLVMYSRKIWIILVKSRQNSVEYFKANRMRKFQNDVYRKAQHRDAQAH